jgi:hypothetical protein
MMKLKLSLLFMSFVGGLVAQITALRVDQNQSIEGVYGIVELNNQIFNTNTFVVSTNGLYVLPSAGTYRLTYSISSDGTGANSNNQFEIQNASNVMIAGTERTRGGSVTTSQVLHAEVIVSILDATTYKLVGRNGGSGSVTILNTAVSGSVITWEKVADFIPLASQRQERVGRISTGDVGGGTTSGTGTGDTPSFTKLNETIFLGAARSTYTVTLSTPMPTANYLVFVIPISVGTAIDDNNIFAPVVISAGQTVNTFRFMVEENASATQNMDYGIFIKQL